MTKLNESDPPAEVVNFSHDLRFTPRRRYEPVSEEEVLEILDRHADGKIRVIGARHSWSDGIVSDDVLIDLRHFDHVELERSDEGAVSVVVGGGCRVKHLVARLHSLAD